MRLKSFFIMSFRSLENFLNMAFFVLSHQQPFMAAGHIDYISCKSFDDTAVRILADNRFFSVIRFLGPSCEVQPVPVSEAESFGITDGETAFVGPDHLKVVLRSLPGDHQGRAVQEKVIAVVCFGKRHGGSLFYAAKIAIVLEHPYQGLLEIYQEYAYVPTQKWEDLYESSLGFARGTIFAQLDKPFIGEEAVPNGSK